MKSFSFLPVNLIVSSSSSSSSSLFLCPINDVETAYQLSMCRCSYCPWINWRRSFWCIVDVVATYNVKIEMIPRLTQAIANLCQSTFNPDLWKRDSRQRSISRVNEPKWTHGILHENLRSECRRCRNLYHSNYYRQTTKMRCKRH